MKDIFIYPLQNDALAPLYHKRDVASPTPNPAHVDVDMSDGDINVRAGYNPEPGLIPFEVFEGRVIRLAVPADVSGKALVEYLESERFEELVHQLCEGWIGGRLNDEAADTESVIERDLEFLDCVNVGDPDEYVEAYLDDDILDTITTDTPDAELRDLADQVTSQARDLNCHINGSVYGYLSMIRREKREAEEATA